MFGAEPPGHSSEPRHHQIADADARPVEVAVIRQLGTGSRQLAEQGLLGSGGNAVGADQRGAAWSQPIGCECQHCRVLADVDPLACRLPLRRITERWTASTAGI